MTEEPRNDLKAQLPADWESLGMIEAGQEKLYLGQANEDPEELAVPYPDYQDYRYRGIVIGSTEVFVFKLQAHPETTLLYPIAEPSYPRLSPPDTVALLKSCIDLRLIHRLIIRDGLHEDEFWFKQTTSYKYEKEQIALEAEATSADTITLYRPQNLEAAAEPFDREWLTLLQRGSPRVSGIFDQVKELEELRADNPNIHMSEVAWCWFGRMILHPNPAVFLIVAEQNPIRCALIAEAIKERMQNLPGELQSPRHEQIISRCQYMAEKVSTGAEHELMDRLTNPNRQA